MKIQRFSFLLGFLIATIIGCASILLLYAQRPKPVPKPVINPDLESVKDWVNLKKVDTILSGTVRVDSHLRVPLEGTLQLRLVDLGRNYRPILFHYYPKVTLPFNYELKTSDFVGPMSLAEIKNENFYVEAMYSNFEFEGKKVTNRWQSVMGEAWGEPGRPYPLRFGQTKDVVLDGWWTEESFGTKPPAGKEDKSTTSAGWVYISFALQEDYFLPEKMTVKIAFCDRNPLKTKPIALSTTELAGLGDYGYWSSNSPALSHQFGFVVAYTEVREVNGYTATLYGARASRRISIPLAIDTVKISMNRTSTVTPFEPCLIY